MQECKSGKEKEIRARPKSKESGKIVRCRRRSFFRGKRTPLAENSDELSQRCKENMVHVNEEIIEECRNVGGHKRGAHLSE